MLIKKQLYRLFPILVFLFLVTACGGGDGASDSAKIESISIQSAEESIAPNSSQQLQVIAKFSDGSEKDITEQVLWSITNERIASIDKNGNLSSKKYIAGVEVKVQYRGLSATRTIQIVRTESATVSELVFDDANANVLKNADIDQEITFSAIYSDGTIQENIKAVIEEKATTDDASNSHFKLTFDTTKVEIDVPVDIDTTEPVTLAATSVTETADTGDSPTLLGIKIITSDTDLVSGEIQTISLEGSYSDDSVSDIGIDADWTTKGPITFNQNDSTVSANTVTNQTSATLTADYLGKTASLTFNIGAAGSGSPNTGGNNSETDPDKISDGDDEDHNDDVIVTVTSLSINPNSLSIEEGKEQTLILNAKLSDNSSQNNIRTGVQWSISDSNIATISDAGVLKAITPGSTQVTANYSGQSVTMALTVEAFVKRLSSIQIHLSESFLYTTKSMTVTATGFYNDDSLADITNDVSWTSSDEEIISISSGTEITLTATKNSGQARIIAALEGKSQSVPVNVTVPGTAIVTKLLIPSPAITMKTNGSYTDLSVSAEYDDGSVGKVTSDVLFSSSKPSIVSVASNGYLQSFGTVGKAVITITHPITLSIAELEVNVIPNDDAEIASLYFANPPTTLFFNQNTSLTLRAKLSDSSDVLIEQDIQWRSGNEEIAIVNGAGLVTANNISGHARIEAVYNDPINDKRHITTTGIFIEPENSFDNLNISFDGNSQKILIEDNSDFPPILKAFDNPVGITDDIKFTTTQTGTYITYSSGNSHERLALVLPNTTDTAFNQNNSMAFYVPNDNNSVLYRLDDSGNTNLTIALNTYGGIGNITNGHFSATLCAEVGINANTCHLPSNKISIEGSFYITVENGLNFQSKDNFDAPLLLTDENMDQMHQIASAPNYHYEPTNQGVTYNFRTNNPDVIVEVVDTANKTSVLTQSSAQDGGQVATYTATDTKTILKLSYKGSADGTTYTLSNSTDAPVPEGTADNPLLIGGGSIPALSFGTVDTTNSYYQLDVLPGHSYLVFLDKPDEFTANISFELSDLKTGTFKQCVGLANSCEIKSDTGKIFIKVNGDTDEGAAYKIEVEFAPDRDIVLSAPTIDHLGQVSYKQGFPSAVGSDQRLSSGISTYWVDGTSLQNVTHYRISTKGMTSYSEIWINNNAGALVGNCVSASEWSATYENENYCIVRTGLSASRGFGINVKSFGKGTPYLLSVEPVEDSRVFYVSTYGNSAVCTNPTFGCSPDLTMNFFRPGENEEFMFVKYQRGSKPTKAILLDSGETILIRLGDIDNDSGFYSMQIKRNLFITNPSAKRLIDDPDEFEFDGGDNTADAAIPIELNLEMHHSFSSNNGQFGDVDWVSFTAP